MLGKLLSNEMKASARLLLPLYLVLAVLTIMDRIVIYLDIFKGALKVIPGIITFAYVISIIAVIVVSTFFMIFIRFYKNLMTDEGYLMFTLPVKSHDLINSKLIISFFWSIISLVAVTLSILFVFSGSSHFSELPDAFAGLGEALKQAFGSSGASLFVIEMIALFVISIINGILMIYVSIAVGQLFTGHKVLGSIAAYIVINIAVQVIVTVITAIAAVTFNDTVAESKAVINIIFPLTILFLTVLTVAYYWVTNLIFKRKLNLD